MNEIDEIKSRLDIVEIISTHVSLRKTGRSYVGFCPFHANTRTPAFTVYPDTQTFYCFGCHAAGTVFDFVMRSQGLEFREALEQLAAQVGIQLKEHGTEEQQQDQQRTRLLDINATAAKYFNYVLLNLQSGQPGRDYIAQRGISTETVEVFQLGYSLDDWSRLLTYLTERKGFTPEEVEAAGLAIAHEQRGYYDRFRGRLIFPIRNMKGDVIGFGGRALGDTPPKYLNTPQTLLFDKSNVLYGLDLARTAIRDADATVVVEGYIDVITAHQYGFKNIVAPLGTALTQNHVNLLKKLSHNVYLALDADAAGQRATLRGLNILRENTAIDNTAHPVTTAQGLVRWESDITLRIIKMPEGQDPDEVIKADPKRWAALVNTAIPVMDFYIEAYTHDLDLSQAQGQRIALDRLLPLLSQLDGTQQRVYLARLEQVIGIKAELILDLLHGTAAKQRGLNKDQFTPQHKPYNANSTQHAPPSATTPTAMQSLSREDHLLALMLQFPSTYTAIAELLEHGLQSFPQIYTLLGVDPINLLEHTENRMIWQNWNAWIKEQHVTSNPGISRDMSAELHTSWLQGLDKSLQPHAERLIHINIPHLQEYRYRQEAENCARYLHLEQVRRWQLRISRHIGDTTDEAEIERLTTILLELQNYLVLISTPRRTVTFSDLRDTLGRES